MPQQGGVLILGEVAEGQLSPATLEVLGIARKLADQLPGPLGIAILGQGVSALANDAIAYGADVVHVVDHAAVADFTSDAYVGTTERIAKDVKPSVLLLAHTANGREVGPRLAVRLQTGQASDCIEFSLENGRLTATRPCFGGAIRQTVTWPEGAGPQLATVRPKTFDQAQRNAGRQGEIIAVGSADGGATRFLEQERVKTEGVKLEDAEIVVSGGRGLGNADNFKQIEDLAKVLGAAVGASRAIVDEGWVPYAYQVGLTGKTVSPNLYIAVGISGASQHMAGCAGSRAIVAINRDESADVFKYARFGVVGEYQKILPAFQRKLQELLGG